MRALRAWQWAVAALILTGLGWQFAAHAPPDWSVLGAPSLAPLAIAAVLGTASYVVLATAWASLRGGGESWLDVGGTWFASLLARYAPGGIWQGAVRASGDHARGGRLRDALARYATEQALGCFSAASLALLLFAVGPLTHPALIVGVAFVAIAAALSPIALTRFGAMATWPLAAVGWTFVAHLLMAFGFSAFVASVAPVDSVDLALNARAFLVAGLAGVLAVFVPAGLGVREGVLAWLLAPRLGIAIAVAIALAARVGLLACELAAWGLWAMARHREARP